MTAMQWFHFFKGMGMGARKLPWACGGIEWIPSLGTQPPGDPRYHRARALPALPARALIKPPAWSPQSPHPIHAEMGEIYSASPADSHRLSAPYLEKISRT